LAARDVCCSRPVSKELEEAPAGGAPLDVRAPGHAGVMAPSGGQVFAKHLVGTAQNNARAIGIRQSLDI
jgi:hypothetical protein